MPVLGRISHGVVWVASRPVVYPMRGARWLLASFRFWVLLLVALILALVGYYALADQYTPFTTDAYVQAYVVQVAPQVAGQVTRVYVQEGARVKAADLLFTLDARPFEHKIAYLQAKLVEAEQQVKQLGAELAAAKASHERAEAEEALASIIYQQEQQIFKTESTTERKFVEAQQKHKASQAAVRQSAQAAQKIQDALNARIGTEHALVAQVKAQLEEARLNLAYCRVVAPCDGIITNLQLRDGSYVHVGQAALTVIDVEHWHIIANFRENSLRQLRDGLPALVGLQSAPGELFAARIVHVGWGVGQGQGVPSGLLPEVKRQTSWVPPAQRFQVRLELDKPQELPLRVGMTGSVSVYVEPEHRLNGITRAWHQFIAWLYYL